MTYGNQTCPIKQNVVFFSKLYAYGEKAWRQILKNATRCIEQVLELTSHKTAAVRPPTTHHENDPH